MNNPGENFSAKNFQVASSAQQLMARARGMTRIDILDTSAEEGLTHLLHSCNTEAQLNQRGAQYLERHLLRVLCNRLRMQRDFRAHPEIAQQKIVKPLFIIGNPRTGSTKLHKMLAASDDFLWLPFWQAHCLSLRNGDRHEDPAERIHDADQYIRWMDQYAPRAQRNHGYSTFEPEEEMLICEHSLCAVFPGLFAEVPSYIAWWATQDFRGYVEFLKQGLQYLQWQFHDGDPRPWILKCPVYFGVEHLIAEVLPGARFVSTHRHPLSSVPSTINLVNGYREACSDTDWRRALGANYCEALALGCEQMIAVRDAHPELNILNISYASLTSNVEQVAENIYPHIGMGLSHKAKQAMRRWDQTHAEPKSGAKDHSLADFGLTEAMINQRYRRYIELFKPYF